MQSEWGFRLTRATSAGGACLSLIIKALSRLIRLTENLGEWSVNAVKRETLTLLEAKCLTKELLPVGAEICVTVIKHDAK